MKTAVVILNWNGRKFLEQFLPSVIQHSAEATVFVADNGSTDDSVSYLQKIFPQVSIVSSAENRGFAGGYNQTLKEIKADYFILLNSDVEVTEGWIKPIIDLMDSDKTIAACQPKIRMHADKKMFEYAGAAGGFIDKYGYPFCRGRVFETLEEDKGQYNDNIEVFWATGACMFVRSEVFFEAGGFDEEFFAHMEEIDLCWRMKNLGHKIMYCGSSTVYHVGGGTLQKSNPFKTYLNFRNSLMMLIKNTKGLTLIRLLFIRIILDDIAQLKFILSGNFKDFVAVLKAQFYVFFHFFKIIKKRKTVKENVSGVYNHSIVADYFLRGKKKFSELDF
jgi:GT2 family glycosyltransferase